jgi:hypothetical protein
LHWDVTNLTDDTLNLMVTRNIIQLVSPYNLPCIASMPKTAHSTCKSRPSKPRPFSRNR